ncbi:MAG: hypothetical protein D3926_00685 [Desulfobacteraceae bacterium]|nr:MAG: hypothetical protein D3926_00685 [Desulfobacteraceae bacterium]
MRGAFIIVILIAMLIAALLVYKNLDTQTSSSSEGTNIQSVETARDVSETAQEKLDSIKQKLGEIE